MTMIKNKFAATIQVYDQYAAKFSAHFEKKLDTTELNKFINLLPPKASVLDAGCGSARDAAYFISQGFQALGIDLSDGLLAQAKKLHPEVKTLKMSLTDLKFSSESFDGIWCKAALLHLDRREIPKVLSDFYQILKPNGVIFIQTKSGEGEAAQPTPFDPNLERFFTFFTLAEMQTLLEAAGFAVLESYDFNGKARFENSRNQDWLVCFARKNQ